MGGNYLGFELMILAKLNLPCKEKNIWILTFPLKQVMVKDLCRILLKRNYAIAEELDKTANSVMVYMKKMGDCGFAAFPFLKNARMGIRLLSMIIAIEEISRGDAPLGNSLLDSVTLAMNLLLHLRNRGQKKKCSCHWPTGKRLGHLV